MRLHERGSGIAGVCDACPCGELGDAPASVIGVSMTRSGPYF